MIHVMAIKNVPFNFYATHYENFLALSVSIRVGKHQLMMETPTTSRSHQALVLRYKDTTITTEYLKETLSAVCPLVGVHNVARVKQGALPLVEVDFTDEKALERFCKSISDGKLQKKLQQKLKGKIYGSQEVGVTVKLHLIMPNTQKKSPVSREVTTANYHECFSLIRESALFEFESLNIAHDIIVEEAVETMLSFTDLPDLLQELAEIESRWYTVGTFLKIEYFRLEAIKDNTSGCTNQGSKCLREMLATWLRGADASPGILVEALKSAAMIGLAKKVAVKYGIPAVFSIESKVVEEPHTSPQNTIEDLIKAFTNFVTHGSQESGVQAIPADLSALAFQQKGIVTIDAQHSALSERVNGLKKRERKVTDKLEQAKSSLESVKDHVDKLRQEQESLIEKRERRKASKRWLVKQRASKSGEDLDEINQMIRDTEEAVADLSRRIDELEKRIKAQNEQVAEMTTQLVQNEQEKQQLMVKIGEIEKEKTSLENKLEEDRRKFENEIQRIMTEGELRVSETKAEMLKDELSHKRTVELAQAQSASTTNPRPAVNDSNRAEFAQSDNPALSEQAVDDSSRAKGLVTTTVDTQYCDVPSLVLDGGSLFFKAGFGGEDAPRAVFPSVVGRNHLGRTYVGDKASYLIHSLKYPIKNGSVTNWDDMEMIWNHVFSSELRVDPKEHRVLLTESPLIAKFNKEKKAQIMFETFNTPAVYVANSSATSLYATGRITGFVLESGDGITTASIFNDGLYNSMFHAERLPLFSGADLTNHLTDLLSQPSYSHRIIRDIKEKLCYVDMDFEFMMQTNLSEKKSYELPDGQVITLGNELLQCPEALFSYQYTDRQALKEVYVPQICYQSIMKHKANESVVVEELFSNMVLSGGNTLFPGFAERLKNEITTLVPSNMRVNVIAPPERKYLAWIGGSFLATLSGFQNQWISKQLYDEHGPSIV